jgi:hypothetical protein
MANGLLMVDGTGLPAMMDRTLDHDCAHLKPQKYGMDSITYHVTIARNGGKL